MAYLAVTLNHFRPIQAWARRTGAEATLNAATFELELKARNRYYLMHPRFLIKQGGRFAHSSELTSDAVGFIGWLPYRLLRWDLSNDKIQFKSLLRSQGEATPESAADPSALPYDFVLKRSIGSFGNELAGPFRAGQTASDLAQQMPASGNPAATLYAERFIAGTNVKIWFWGATPFHAHRDEYPAVMGDGSSSLGELVTKRLNSVGMALDAGSSMDALPDGDRKAMESTLAYQGVSWNDVLAAGRAVWLDYRYGRRYDSGASSSQSDNALHTFSAVARDRIAAIGALLSSALKPQFQVSVLYSVDGVLDAFGKLWWLEMNSNPILPPEGYPLILNSLFGSIQANPEQGTSTAPPGAPGSDSTIHEQVLAA